MLTILFQLIGATGAIATIIGLFIKLEPYRLKLKVTGEFPIRNSNVFVIHIKNTRNSDNEIKSIVFIKGDPNKFNHHIFYSVSFDDYGEYLSPVTNNILVHHSSYVDIPVSCKCVVCNYEKIGEALGKPFDTIFIQIQDTNGHTYRVNTHANVEFFRRLGK